MKDRKLFSEEDLINTNKVSPADIPKSISNNDPHRSQHPCSKTKRPSPLKAIRKNCLECHGGARKSARFCSSYNCELWMFRFGKRPETLIRIEGEESGQLFVECNFKIGAKFCPLKLVSEFEL